MSVVLWLIVVLVVCVVSFKVGFEVAAINDRFAVENEPEFAFTTVIGSIAAWYCLIELVLSDMENSTRGFTGTGQRVRAAALRRGLQGTRKQRMEAFKN